jgi:YhcH/YjgK/YiaL family protein
MKEGFTVIYDYVKNLNVYAALLPRIENYIKFMVDSWDLPVGRYELSDGDFVLVQEGATKPVSEGKFEAHKNFLDLQVVVAGKENIKWQNIDLLNETVPYDEAVDKVNFSGEGDTLSINEGMFYIMFPEDGHMACVHLDAPSSYRKLVIKIKL